MKKDLAEQYCKNQGEDSELIKDKIIKAFLAGYNECFTHGIKGKVFTRVGEKHITNQGYVIEIIEYYNCKNVTIKFEDGFEVKNLAYNNIKNGGVWNANHRSVCGIGYFGYGSHLSKDLDSNKTSKKYDIWSKMISRCYSESSINKYPTYKDVTVCEEWHNFQNFGDWFEENYNFETMKGWDLDKDIICPECRIYSPKTCCFVPHEINSLFSVRIKEKLNIKKNYITSIHKTIEGKKYSEYLGYFNNFEDSFQAYKEARESYMREIADKWKNLIDKRVYDTMYNYKVVHK